MKLNRGMWLDGNPSQNPLDTTRINKGIVVDPTGAKTNEIGHRLVPSYEDNKKELGVITLDSNDFIVFSLKNGKSEIGYVDEQLNYKVLSNDERYNFSIDYPIHGTFQRTPQGNIVIVWTDTRSTHYADISKPFNSQSSLLFYTGESPSINSRDVKQGGSLKAGAYYIIFSFERQDQSVTNWFKGYNPIVVTGASKEYNSGFNDRKSNDNTNKLISFNVVYNNPDGNFSKLRIGIVSKINGVLSAALVKSVPIIQGINLTTSQIIDGNEIVTPIDLNEVIIDIPPYKNVKHITQMQGTLYLTSLVEYKEPSYQHLLNNLEFVFTSELMDVTNTYKDSYYYIDRKSFGHGEVYAVYLRFKYKWGKGRWYHCPGRVANYAEKDSEGGYLKYQLHDTCTYNFGVGEGELSYWENRDELYPNITEYPSGNVRHHKFPSIRWMKQNVYNNVNDYGVTRLDILGLKLKTSINLSSFKDCDGNDPIGFELGYAKHTINNALNVGQSIIVFPSDRADDEKYGETSLGINIRWTNPTGATPSGLIKNAVRTYPVEALFEKVNPSVSHIRLESEMEAITYLQRNPEEDTYRVAGINIYDYYPSSIPVQEILEVQYSEYLINNTIKGKTDNTYLESSIRLQLKEEIIGLREVDFGSIGGDVKVLEYAIPTVLVTLLNIKNNCYYDFKSQQVIPSDSDYEGGYKIYGDMFINSNGSTITYGLSQLTKDYTTDPEKREERHEKSNGFRFMHVYVFESLYNLKLRYENPDVLGGYSLYYKYSNEERGLLNLDGDKEPNSLVQSYSEDFNAQNDLSYQDVYNPDSLYTGEYPFRVIRGLSNQDDLTFGSWIRFLPENKYELPRDKGEVVHTDSGRDYLIFHMKNALLTTRPSGELQMQGQTVYLGVGNIFQHNAVEVIHDKLGALGTSHKWSCKMTKYGYIWIDHEQKVCYIFDNEVKAISNNGLYDFFINNAFTIGDNPFKGNGYHTSIDENNKRILITRKSVTLKDEYKDRYKGIWRKDQNFLNSLSTGDIIYKDGQFKLVQ